MKKAAAEARNYKNLSFSLSLLQNPVNNTGHSHLTPSNLDGQSQPAYVSTKLCLQQTQVHPPTHLPPPSPSFLHPTIPSALLLGGALELIDQEYWLSLCVEIQTKNSPVEAATPSSPLSLTVLKKGAYNWNEE